MGVVGFVVAVVSILGSVASNEPISWGVAVLMVALLFRLFWSLSKPHEKNN